MQAFLCNAASLSTWPLYYHLHFFFSLIALLRILGVSFVMTNCLPSATRPPLHSRAKARDSSHHRKFEEAACAGYILLGLRFRSRITTDCAAD